MHADKQRIAIAEACGWKLLVIPPSTMFHVVSPDGRMNSSAWATPELAWSLGFFERKGPDYLTDLNAMHEAEKVLTEDVKHRYDKELSDIIEADAEEHEMVFIYHATAAQKAEAFRRTLNLQDSA